MLNTEMRGTLEQIIDQLLTAIPQKPPTRREDMEKLHIENEHDYTLGFAHGAIMGNFVVVFMVTMKRPLHEEEEQEARSIVFNRTPQIRDAMFKSG
jgi:hypothetical protein